MVEILPLDIDHKVLSIDFEIFFSKNEINFVCLIEFELTLSGEDIGIKVVLHQRYTASVDGLDTWKDLRPFLKF